MKFMQAISVLAAIVFLAIIHLYIYTKNITLKFEVNDLKVKLSNIRSINRQLGSLVAQKESLDRVEKIAKQKLGMTYPEEIIYLETTLEAAP